MDKKQLRKICIDERNSIPLGLKNKYDASIINKIINLYDYKIAKNIAIYKAFGSEIDLNSLEIDAIKNKKTLYYPFIISKGKMEFYKINSEKDMIKNKFGIYEPIPREEMRISPDRLDLIIVPMLAYDIKLNRIGYGGGFYDRYLTQVNCKKIGICYSQFLKNNVYAENWDIKLDSIITSTD